MAFGFLGKALSVVGNAVGVGSIGDAVKTIKNAIDGNDELAAELRKLEIEEQRLLLEEARSIHGLYREEIKSEDAFVRRARPALLWLIFALLAINFGIIPITNSVASYCGWTPVVITIPELPQPLYYLIGTVISVYTGARSWDKKNKARNGGV